MIWSYHTAALLCIGCGLEKGLAMVKVLLPNQENQFLTDSGCLVLLYHRPLSLQKSRSSCFCTGVSAMVDIPCLSSVLVNGSRGSSYSECCRLQTRVCHCRDVCSQVMLALLLWVLLHGGSLLLTVVQECPSTSWYVAIFLSVP